MQNLLNFQENYGFLLNSERDRLQRLSQLIQNLSLSEDLLPYFEAVNHGIKPSSVNQFVKDSKQQCPTSPKLRDRPSAAVSYNAMPQKDFLYTNDCYSNALWLSLGSYEEKRKKLAEERRREYNEYLKEKARNDEERRQRARSAGAVSQINFMDGVYKDILDQKRKEEKEYRDKNCLNSIEEEHLMESTPSPMTFTPFTECRNDAFTPFNVDDEFESARYITPRSRLLNTHSSREKAAKYKEELMEQIRDKKRREAEEKEKILRNEAKMEAVFREQQRKIQLEFEEEQKRLHRKTVDLAVDVAPQIAKSVTKTKKLACPLYAKHSSLKSPSKKTSKPQLNESPKSNLPRQQQKAGVPKLGGSNQPTNQVFKSSPSNHEVSSLLPNGAGDSNAIKGVNERNYPVLARLAEVRKQMQENHFRMLEQLRERNEF